MQVSSKHNKTHLLKSLDAFLSPAAGFDGPPPIPMFKKQEELRSQTCVPECCLVNAAAAAAQSLQSCPTLCDLTGESIKENISLATSLDCVFSPFLLTRLEKEMATHSSTLAWKIPWMEEPGGLQSLGS